MARPNFTIAQILASVPDGSPRPKTLADGQVWDLYPALSGKLSLFWDVQSINGSLVNLSFSNPYNNNKDDTAMAVPVTPDPSWTWVCWAPGYGPAQSGIAQALQQALNNHGQPQQHPQGTVTYIPGPYATRSYFVNDVPTPKQTKRQVSMNGRDWVDYDKMNDPDPFDSYKHYRSV